MRFLIRFSQVYETFRLAEIEALALVENVELKMVSYSLNSPFCVADLPSADAARRLVRRSILVMTIHELWGSGATLDDLHASIRNTTSRLWEQYLQCSFKFSMDSYQGSRSAEKRVSLFNTFAYLGFQGPIRMKKPDEEFTLFEQWPPNSVPLGRSDPDFFYLGRYVGTSARDILPKKLDLKKRRYISTTSMDAELCLVTANIAMAATGKIVYDPFVGTGSFPLACAEYGALTFGSDIDGRSIRGNGNKSLRANFEQYGLLDGLGGMFSADLTNSPIRRQALGGTTDGIKGRLFDAIICDPPYGVREGLFVLGVRDPEKSPWIIPKGMEMYKLPEYNPPKKPYGFLAMLDDILQFAAQTLVDNGRISFWMPTANDENLEIPVPTHPYLEMIAICTQAFNKWSRRLITYRRLPDESVGPEAVMARVKGPGPDGKSADELNPFRRGYFTKFAT